MTAPTDIQALVGAKIYISATLPETFDAAGYTSTDFVGQWSEITLVESMAPHGGTKTVTPFKDVATGTIKKVGGASDYGMKSLVVGHLASDTGQLLCKTAFDARNTHYSVKVEYDDGNAVTDEIHYLDVLVTRYEFQDGDADAVRRKNIDLTLCRAPVIVAPT